MDYLNLDPQIRGSLLDLLSVALAAHKPDAGPDMNDIELLINAMRIFHSKRVEFGIFDAMAQMKRGLLDDAIKSLQHIVEVRSQFTFAKALLAYYLFLRRDINWRSLAAEVLKRNEPAVAVNLMHAIERQEALASGALSAEQLIELSRLVDASNNTTPQTAPAAEEDASDLASQLDLEIAPKHYLRV